MSGQGGVGILMLRSRSIKNRHGSSSTFVTVSALGSLDCDESQLFSCLVVTVTVVSNCGHGGGGGSGGIVGGWQSKIGGGGSAIEHSETKLKSRLAIESTSHLSRSKRGAAIRYLRVAVTDKVVLRKRDDHGVCFSVCGDVDARAANNVDATAADTVNR